MHRRNLLVIDDDDFFAVHLERLLGECCRVAHAVDGLSGIQKAEELQPDVILLDVEMPGVDGFEICRRLKQAPSVADIPVIFISAMASPASRMAGYDAGGEDFLAKPLIPDELRRKVAIVLRSRQQQRKLSETANTATKLAFNAMASASDVGMVLDFMRHTAEEISPIALADSTLQMLASLGLEAALQIRTTTGTLSRSHRGRCSDLEQSVLSNLSRCGRITEVGRRCAFNYENATIIVHNLGLNPDMDSCRQKEVLIMLAEALNIRVSSLSATLEAIQRGDSLLGLLRSNIKAIQAVDRNYKSQREECNDILNDMILSLEDSFLFLGLSENQESFLQNMVRDAVDRALALYNTHTLQAEHVLHSEVFRALNIGDDTDLQQEVDGATTEGADIELF